jgi:hypothetical protein
MRKPLLPLAAALLCASAGGAFAQGYPSGNGPIPVEQNRGKQTEDQTPPQAHRSGAEMGTQAKPEEIQRSAHPQEERMEMRSGTPHTTKTLTVEQRTKIRTTVMRSAPHVNVNFRVSVGAFVPRTVQLVPVPVEVVDVYPQWSGYLFFAEGDQIVVVDPNSYAIVGMFSV